MSFQQQLLSIVIPVFNEAESLKQLHLELSNVIGEQGYSAEMIFIDDGSTDGSWQQIESLSQKDSRVRGIRFRRNFGKAAALSTGFEAAEGELVFTMDADLQDHPQELPRFIAQIEAGYDVVSGWKQVRHDPFHKRYPSKVFNSLVGWLTKVKLHDHNCGYKCYRREVVKEVELYGELHRFVPVLAAARGFTVSEIAVEHRAREHGHSKYGFSRFVKGLLDLMTVYFLTGYQKRPQHLLGTLGLACFLLGGLGMVYLAIYWLVRISSPELQASWQPVHERPLLIYSVGAFLLGAQWLTAGFLAELITAQSHYRPNDYSVRETTSGEPQNDSSASARTLEE